jgi:hypothetical protein
VVVLIQVEVVELLELGVEEQVQLLVGLQPMAQLILAVEEVVQVILELVTSSSGGKGVVILSMLDADYSGTTTGSPTVATGVSGKTVLTFTGTGSYTA